MSVKIYVVFGESGEYSDAEHWMVKAYYNYDNAKMLLENAQKEADILQTKADDGAIHYWETEGLNKYDPYYKMVYHEVTYDIVEVELE